MPPSNLFSTIRAVSRRATNPRLPTNHQRALAPFSTSRFYSQQDTPSQPQSPPPRRATTIPRPQERVPPKAPPPSKPTYELTFTCIPCSTRSTHSVSKQGYHHGSVLITCPECKNRHIISDHLNVCVPSSLWFSIFGDKSITIEDLMRERGMIVKKGTLSNDGDVEFWEDGTSNARILDESAKPSDGAT
ncbi:hypothetical protein HYALB_00004343 [Hymenoscyphus albidus]|uniref:DNL-type domain-containing protein n=1 Tax=Hymenoscyphus albidus TaxID=595503 RepID=A0A9N9M3L6_9HELO|nr:hypothetical protein HYALB_00004343 [Hymenoscyphus albidus]